MNNLISLLDSVLPIVEIWKAETPAQEVWKEKWLRQAREVVDKPKEYCTCEGGKFFHLQITLPLQDEWICKTCQAHQDREDRTVKYSKICR